MMIFLFKKTRQAILVLYDSVSAVEAEVILRYIN